MTRKIDFDEGYRTGREDILRYGINWAKDIVVGVNIECDYDRGYIAAIMEYERSKA